MIILKAIIIIMLIIKEWYEKLTTKLDEIVEEVMTNKRRGDE